MMEETPTKADNIICAEEFLKDMMDHDDFGDEEKQCEPTLPRVKRQSNNPFHNSFGGSVANTNRHNSGGFASNPPPTAPRRQSSGGSSVLQNLYQRTFGGHGGATQNHVDLMETHLARLSYESTPMGDGRLIGQTGTSGTVHGMEDVYLDEPSRRGLGNKPRRGVNGPFRDNTRSRENRKRTAWMVVSVLALLLLGVGLPVTTTVVLQKKKSKAVVVPTNSTNNTGTEEHVVEAVAPALAAAKKDQDKTPVEGATEEALTLVAELACPEIMTKIGEACDFHECPYGVETCCDGSQHIKMTMTCLDGVTGVVSRDACSAIKCEEEETPAEEEPLVELALSAATMDKTPLDPLVKELACPEVMTKIGEACDFYECPYGVETCCDGSQHIEMTMTCTDGVTGVVSRDACSAIKCEETAPLVEDTNDNEVDAEDNMEEDTAEEDEAEVDLEGEDTDADLTAEVEQDYADELEDIASEEDTIEREIALARSPEDIDNLKEAEDALESLAEVVAEEEEVFEEKEDAVGGEDYALLQQEADNLSHQEDNVSKQAKLLGDLGFYDVTPADEKEVRQEEDMLEKVEDKLEKDQQSIIQQEAKVEGWDYAKAKELEEEEVTVPMEARRADTPKQNVEEHDKDEDGQ